VPKATSWKGNAPCTNFSWPSSTLWLHPASTTVSHEMIPPLHHFWRWTRESNPVSICFSMSCSILDRNDCKYYWDLLLFKFHWCRSYAYLNITIVFVNILKDWPGAVVRAVSLSQQVMGLKQPLRRFCGGEGLPRFFPSPDPTHVEDFWHWVCPFFSTF
jgi:hypothetical protein